MNRRSLAGLLLFTVLITASLFAGANYLTGIHNANEYKMSVTDATGADADAAADEDSTVKSESNEILLATAQEESTTDESLTINEVEEDSSESEADNKSDNTIDIVTEEPWLSANPTDNGSYIVGNPDAQADATDIYNTTEFTDETTAALVNTAAIPELIYDCTKVDYMAYVPEMLTDNELITALDITNPDIKVDAKAAILFDADTKEILYYKNPVQAMFPASTAKLLTSLIALNWCAEDEQVTVGDEIKMIASDSTKAGLREGQVLTVHNLLEGMLLPSGNDAAYAIAAYVGRKSLDNSSASKEEAIAEFVRLMNKEAKSLGVKNSCFKTPDGYDALGQYTTAYDMGLIGVASVGNSTIVEISSKSRSHNTYVSGEEVTWRNTNKLINREYGDLYYSNAIGLKTGTTTQAGRNIIAAAKRNGKTVVCVVMDSTQSGRWEDAIALLKYGLK